MCLVIITFHVTIALTYVLQLYHTLKKWLSWQQLVILVETRQMKLSQAVSCYSIAPVVCVGNDVQSSRGVGRRGGGGCRKRTKHAPGIGHKRFYLQPFYCSYICIFFYLCRKISKCQWLKVNDVSIIQFGYKMMTD